MKRPLALPSGKIAALFVDLQEEHRQDSRFLAYGYDAVVDTDAAFRLLAGETVEAWQIEGAVPLRYGFDTAAVLYEAL